MRTPIASLAFIALLATATRTSAQQPTREPTREPEKETRKPFTGDYTWMNGQSKQKTFPLAFSDAITLSLYLDTHYAYSFNQPLDHTLTGSASVARHDEVQINLASVGVEWSFQNVIGRLSLQYGSMLNVVQELDGTVMRGRSASTDALKYIREATLGYHFDAGYGINVEAGMFMSYIGLESYLLAENWNYHRSIVCDFTPFYFTGLRTQFFPAKNLKIEPWLMNGYQTYGKWNDAPSGGMALRWNPDDAIGLFANFYAGTDTRGDAERVRFHHDHSVLVRYFQDEGADLLSKAAFSINNHVGFESGGDGPALDRAYFVGTAVANRLWFMQDHLAVVGRLDLLTHPGGYTAQFPPPGFAAGDDFHVAGVTGTVEIMPTDFFSVRPEVVYRWANVPFFAGERGTTSPDGFQDSATETFVPDADRSQLLLLVGATFRL